jgi:SHAQKYF class myb-like DNA-binding protein
MNKGQWTKDEHEAFLLRWKKYGNSWKDIATIVNTQTTMQVKCHAQYHFQKSLPPKKKARILEVSAVGHQRHRESLPPEKKARILEVNAVGHQRHRESLPPKKKARILEVNAVGHQ